MKIVVPMAGRGSRFGAEHTPKPFLMASGKPMFEWALESLAGLVPSRVIFIVLKEHAARYDMPARAATLYGDRAAIITLDAVTEGQLCTVLAAKALIDGDEDVLIASADTYVVSALAQDIAARREDCKGLISVAKMPGDAWSFARVDAAGRVVEVAEKVRISDHASTGLYYFSHGSELVAAGEAMIARGEKTRGEYYVIPVYQKFIARGWHVGISRASEMWDMGTPAAFAAFEQWREAQSRGAIPPG